MTAIAAILLALSTMPAAPPEASVHRLVIVTAKTNPLIDLSIGDLRRIYLGRIHRLGGHRIVPVMLRTSEPAAKYFLSHVAGMAEIDFTQLWIGAVFRGEVAAAPRLARSPAEACQYVARHQDAIAFVEEVDLESSVKAITIDGRPYTAPDYDLKWTAVKP